MKFAKSVILNKEVWDWVQKEGEKIGKGVSPTIDHILTSVKKNQESKQKVSDEGFPVCEVHDLEYVSECPECKKDIEKLEEGKVHD